MLTDFFPGSIEPRYSPRRADARDVWLTPPHVIQALGPFDLDPCAPAVRPWSTAARHVTETENGLRVAWSGRVWLNPPYSDIGAWLGRLAQHGRGTALVFARTETAAFQDHVWPIAAAALFLRGRLRFFSADGRPSRSTPGAPSVLLAYGKADAAILSSCGLAGAYVQLRGA